MVQLQLKRLGILIALVLTTCISYGQGPPRLRFTQLPQADSIGSILITDSDRNLQFTNNLRYLNSVFSVTGDVEIGGSLTLGTPLSVANGGTGSATQNFVDLSTTQTVGGAKTFTSALTQSGGDVNFDSGTFFVDATNNRVGLERVRHKQIYIY